MSSKFVSDFEKRDCLRRILSTAAFVKSKKPAAILKAIVEADLNGEPISEQIVARTVWPEKKQELVPQNDTLVRAQNTILRKLLKEYDDASKGEDYISLRISKYKPIYSRIGKSTFEQFYADGLRYLNGNFMLASSHLSVASRGHPNHPGIIAANAELIIWALLFGYEGNSGAIVYPEVCAFARGDLGAAERDARRALSIDGRHWRAHVVIGFCHCCRKEWDTAESSFATALQESPLETEAHPWYAAFLLAISKTGRALNLTQQQMRNNPTVPWFGRIHALFLYAASFYSEALQVLTEIEGPVCCFDYTLELAIYSAQDDFSGISKMLGREPHLSTAHPKIVYPVIPILCELDYCLSVRQEDSQIVGPAADENNPQQRESRLEQLRLQREAEIRRYLAAWGRPTKWSRIDDDGMTVDTLTVQSPTDRPRLSAFQRAIGYMALGDSDRAIRFLGEDFNKNHPFLVWMHLWPILDPLRTEKKFRDLIRRMNLP